VRSAADIEEVIRRFHVSIGVIATPATVAQNVADRLVAAGVTSILNFAPVVLSVPSGVEVRKVDLSIELQILAFHAQRRGAAVGLPDRTRGGHFAGRRVGGVPGGDPARTDGQGLSVAGLSPADRPDPAAGLAATAPLNGSPAADRGASDHGAHNDFETGAQAVGT
jgi:redox-sensing transcriptional repressor